MPTNPTKIWLALKSRVDTLVPQPLMPVYDPDATVTAAPPYILVTDARNDPARYGIGGSAELHVYSGTLMLAIHYPIASIVSYTQLIQMAGAIAEHSPAGS